MRIFLVGATGRTGQWILKAGLAHGHQVTALVRGGAARLTQQSPSLRVIEGDLLEVPDLSALVRDHDVIISALDSRTAAAGTSKMIAAAQEAKVSRYIGIAGGGILQLNETTLRRERPNYPARFLVSSEGHLKAWKELEDSDLEWTLMCTPDLLDQPASGQAQALADYMPPGGRSVPAGDVAEFIMNELSNRKFLRKRVGFTC